MMDLVGLQPYPRAAIPTRVQGGQRQRIGIARALVLEPDLVICDEPVSALDVSIQAQVLNLLKSLQRELGLTYVFVAHNMGVVEHISDRVAVMYLGQVVELADRRDLFRKQEHPYTEALMSAIPVPNPELRRQRIILKGDVPSPLRPPEGCRSIRRCQLRGPRPTVDRRAAARGVRRRPLLCLPVASAGRRGRRDLGDRSTQLDLQLDTAEATRDVARPWFDRSMDSGPRTAARAPAESPPGSTRRP